MQRNRRHLIVSFCFKYTCRSWHCSVHNLYFIHTKLLILVLICFSWVMGWLWFYCDGNRLHTMSNHELLLDLSFSWTLFRRPRWAILCRLQLTLYTISEICIHSLIYRVNRYSIVEMNDIVWAGNFSHHKMVDTGSYHAAVLLRLRRTSSPPVGCTYDFSIVFFLYNVCWFRIFPDRSLTRYVSGTRSIVVHPRVDYRPRVKFLHSSLSRARRCPIAVNTSVHVDCRMC